jgi:hypothetical protein
MSPRLSPVMTPSDLPEAELWAACRDGDLDQLGEAFVPVDLPVTATVRAATLAPLVPPRAIVERRSAAWVFGALDTLPLVRSVAIRHSDRVAVARSWRVVVREVVLQADDVESIGGVEVTTPARTAIDLARHQSYDPVVDLDAIARLLTLANLDLAGCRERLDRTRNLPNKRVALRRLTEALLATEFRALAV